MVRKMIALEKNNHILIHHLELVKQNYEDIFPEKEIKVVSFLASEKSQKSEANNSAQFLVVKRTAQKKESWNY